MDNIEHWCGVPARSGAPAPLWPRLTGAPLLPDRHRTIAKKADVRRLGIELGSEVAPSALLGTLPFARQSLPPPYGQNARASLFPLPWTLTPAHPRASSHSVVTAWSRGGRNGHAGMGRPRRGYEA